MSRIIVKTFQHYLIFFFCEVVLFALIVTGVLPRSVVPWFAGLLVLYALLAPLEDTVLFFVASIPFFIAIPITQSFDNFNTWRILSLIIFLRWSFGNIKYLNIEIVKNHRKWHKEHPVATILISLLILSALSLVGSAYPFIGLKRIIYFVNLSLIGMVIYDLAKSQKLKVKRLLHAIAIPTLLATLTGFIQLITTYTMDIFQFVDFWTRQVQRTQFGSAWADIALKANTWFAYYGNALSLRMFSVFPDSHSFPVFILLGLPAVFALAVARVLKRSDGILRSLVHIRGSFWTLGIPAVFLAMLLSGTRGIWAASVGVVLLAFLLPWLLKKRGIGKPQINIFRYISMYFAVFFLLLPLAYVIFVSNQFQVAKEDAGLFQRRVRSIIDIAETSNKERLRIWGFSLLSIKKHPLLGVGIGNFPVVLSQDISLAKAGSSAHNIYLHIAAEMGLPAMILALWLLWIMYDANLRMYASAADDNLKAYYGAMLLCMPWVFAYLLTDAALFDERTFLLFAVTAGFILGNKKDGYTAI